MKIAMYIVVFIFGFLFLFAAYVRLAPTDAATWHQPITANVDRDLPGGAIRVRSAGPEAFAQVDAALRALPRTYPVAGSIEEGRVTYITRSALWGFPDYTTVEHGDGMLKMHARLRFGRSDLGVNAARLDVVLATIEGG